MEWFIGQALFVEVDFHRADIRSAHWNVGEKAVFPVAGQDYAFVQGVQLIYPVDNRWMH